MREQQSEFILYRIFQRIPGEKSQPVDVLVTRPLMQKLRRDLPDLLFVPVVQFPLPLEEPHERK